MKRIVIMGGSAKTQGNIRIENLTDDV